MFKRSIQLTLLALLILIMGACTAPPLSAPDATADAPVATDEVMTDAPADGGFPVTVTDGLGREVTVEAMPQRIVSTQPSNTEILFSVGAGDQVVGVTKYADYPEEATTRDLVGGTTNKSLSVESVIALEPDLVVMGGSQDQAIAALSDAGYTVVVLAPSTFADVYANIHMIGQITGHPEGADAVVAEMQERVAAVTEVVSALSEEERPTVFYEVWHEPLMTAGPNTFIGQMIALAGGRNIFDDVSEDWPQVSAEAVVERNPAVILGPDSHGDQLTPEVIAARPGWSGIDAVQNGRIHLLAGDIVSRPGPRLAQALEEMAKALHPDLFE